MPLTVQYAKNKPHNTHAFICDAIFLENCKTTPSVYFRFFAKKVA